MVFLSFSLVGSEEEGKDGSSPKMSNYFRSKKMAPPERNVAVIMGPEGYYPKHIVAFKGERLRIFLTSLLPTEGCLNIPSKDVFLTARKETITEGLVFFEKSGTHEFNCPTGKMEGKITVLDRNLPGQ